LWVIIDANEGVIEVNAARGLPESPLTCRVREWMGYTVEGNLLRINTRPAD
jgi:hypothetical protein